MSKPRHFDLIVIGTGPASGTVAKKTAEDGRSVAVIESRAYGGTCALRGCNPKKVYTNAASLLDQARRANGKLGTFQNPSIDWSQLLAFKREFTEPVRNKSESSFQKRGIETFHGIGKFSGTSMVEVNGQALVGERIFIGSGARPVELGISGEEHLTLSDDFLELIEIPDHLVFVGAGYISMEFAHVVARYGSKVVVLDRNDRPLAGFDPNLVEQLLLRSTEIGIQFLRNTSLVSISKNAADSYGAGVKSDGALRRMIDTQLVVHGAGRTPNIDAMNLEAGEVRFNGRGIIVDEFMRSVSNPRVFASGDCVAHDQPRLTPVANEQARIVAKNLFSESPENQPDYGIVPRVVFTSPCLAAVGLSEVEAEDGGFDVDVRYDDTSTWGSVRKTGLDCAAYKILVDKATDRVLGAHLLGPAAEEVINLFALAMKFQLTATDLKSTLFAYPTFGADVRRML